MPVVNSCCFKCSNRTGSVVIGALLFVFCLAFLGVCIGLVAGWDDFDTDFLDNTLSRYNSTAADKLRNELNELKKTFQDDIRPVWKKEFISLYCFLPWYALVNILLIIGAKKDIKILVVLWLLFTLGFLIWSFVLVSIMLTYDTSPGFVAFIALAQLLNFAVLGSFVIVVFSFYQELRGDVVKEVLINSSREEEYVQEEEDADA